MAAAVDTTNYASIAKADEHSAIDAQADKAERAATRDARIAAAVQRSKTEYQEQHAFTERRVCEVNQMVVDIQWLHDSPSDLRNETGKAKVDRQRLEYLVTSLCCSDSPRYADALSQILGAADFAKPFAGLTKELVDAGMRCALHEEQLDAAMQLAETTRSAWKTTSAGLVAVVAQVYCMAQRPVGELLRSRTKLTLDAVPPLLVSTASTGIHLPVLDGLAAALGQNDSPTIPPFLRLVETVASRQRASFDRPLFEEPSPHRRTGNVISDHPQIDIPALETELSLDAQGRDALRGTIRRLSTKGDAGEEAKERSVREL